MPSQSLFGWDIGFFLPGAQKFLRIFCTPSLGWVQNLRHYSRETIGYILPSCSSSQNFGAVLNRYVAQEASQGTLVRAGFRFLTIGWVLQRNSTWIVPKSFVLKQLVQFWRVQYRKTIVLRNKSAGSRRISYLAMGGFYTIIQHSEFKPQERWFKLSFLVGNGRFLHRNSA